MATLKYKYGTFGKDKVETNVKGVRVKEEWTIEGVDLEAIAVDYEDGTSKDFSAVQAGWELID